MDGGTVGLRIASAVVVPVLKRLLLPPASVPGAEFGDRPVPIRRLVSFAKEQRTLTEDDLHKLARELVRRAVRAAGPHDPPIGADEHDAVGQALTRTLHALGDLDMDDIHAFALGPERLAAELSRRAGPSTRRLLSDDAARFHDRLLETACVHLMRLFSQRPGFAARAQIEQSREIREQSEKLDRILQRLPDISGQDAQFEEEYARYIVECHGRLTIYGVDLREPDGQDWPLETAYLSLEAMPYRDGADSVPVVNGEPGADRDTGAERAAGPAEAVLASHERVLLRGVAGTGKTTLVQWLALATAQQERLPGRLSHLFGRVPFVLPLRTLARKGAELPMPEDFLRWIGCPLVGTEPDGWAARVLQHGRGVLLVDGSDEIPKDERTRARAWLKKLLAVFPGNLWLLTSRPSALEQGWLAREGFQEFTLAAMRPADMKQFIRRWHTAAGASEELGDSLTLSLRGSPELSRLATNPLMCSLICALHRERRGFLPQGRAALYEAALSMLLERRDLEREVYGGSRMPALDQRSATEPLQRLAYWLIRNERTQLDRQDAVDVVRRLQPSVPRLAEAGTAEEALQHLLERSGLLREPAPGTVNFIHRTFQDFLGARAVLEERDIGMLVNNAHLDQWEDVVQMAVAQARHQERADLLTRLRERGDREQDVAVQARLRLLALASLEQATRLEPAVREAIEDRAARMLPPRSLREARSLAQHTGPLLLRLLPRAQDLEGDEELATAHAICQIGGDAAISRLRGFLRTGQPAVRAQLLDHWDRFDTAVYAEEIVRPLLETSPDETVTVRSPAELDALRTMSGHQRVGLHGDFSPEEIRTSLDPRRLRELRLRGTLQLEDLDLLSAYPELETLVLQGCRNVKDPTPLTRLPRLRRLELRDLPRFEPLLRLADCPRLEGLLVRPGGALARPARPPSRRRSAHAVTAVGGGTARGHCGVPEP